MAVIAIIPARGGSKGLPRKNILPLLGLPLILWTVDYALSANSIDRVVVTTEDEEIRAVVKTRLGVEVIMRPRELATDTATTDEVINHLVTGALKLEQDDILVLLQPTSPCRSVSSIDGAVRDYKSKRGLLLMSGCFVSNETLKAYVYYPIDESLTPLFSDDAPFSPRQSLPSVFKPNGAIYVFSVIDFKKEQRLPRVGIIAFIMSDEESVDVDNAADLVLAERIIKELTDEI